MKMTPAPAIGGYKHPMVDNQNRNRKVTRSLRERMSFGSCRRNRGKRHVRPSTTQSQAIYQATEPESLEVRVGNRGAMGEDDAGSNRPWV
jgi:hypothetical protein